MQCISNPPTASQSQPHCSTSDKRIKEEQSRRRTIKEEEHTQREKGNREKRNIE
jgi:hypothetical protein